MQALRVDLLAGLVEIRPDRRDTTVRDLDVGDLATPSRDHRASADDHPCAKSSRKWLSTSIATATSSVVTDSAGLWLTPPLQRTKSIATSVSSDIVTASCPAPLGSWKT